MKYWLISQNLISEKAKTDIGEKQIGDIAEVHVGNWGKEDLKIEDITEENFRNLGFDKKSESIFQLLNFKNEVKVGDIAILIDSKSSIYGIGKIVSNIKKSEEINIGTKEKGFYKEIKLLYKIKDKLISFEGNEIKEFAKTLRELTKERYEELRGKIFETKNLNNKEKLIGFLIENEAFSKEKGFTGKDIKTIGVDTNDVAINTQTALFGYFIDFDHFTGKYYLIDDGKSKKNSFNEQNDKTINEIINFVINEEKQIISEEQLYNILISLTVNNFLIFSGPSGTGKTSVVQKIAESFNGKDQNGKTIGFHKLPVKSNFTDESAILGYWNPLLSRYEGTETLKFLIDAYKRDESELNFLLLDEMNLSKVENYFSTFLSEIDKLKDYDNLEEKDKPKILLFETNITNKKQYENIKYFLENYFGKDFEDYENNIEFNGNLEDYGESKTDESGNFTKEIKSIKVFLKLKNNIKIIGTINEDETTNSISNKVLDRAQFITFEVGDLFRGDIVGKPFLDVLLIQNNSFFDDIFNIKIKIKAKEDNEKNLKEYFSNVKDDLQKIENIINAINKEIQNISINESIGYRAIEEIMTYIKNYCNYKEENSMTGLTESLDNQISQKILTKLKTFSLVSEDSKKAFKEIGEILEKLEYKDGENIIKINLEGKLEKSINFYKHLKNNLLD